MVYSNTPKTPKFICNSCCFESGNKKDFNRHLLTAKHQKNEELYKKGIKVSKKPIKNPIKSPTENSTENIIENYEKCINL